MDVIHELTNIVNRGFDDNAMAKIEDVAWATRRTVKNILCALLKRRPLCKQRYRIEVALHWR